MSKDETLKYKPGDLPPKSYLAWHAWADVQRKAGIKQAQCSGCGKWITPQEHKEHEECGKVTK